MITVQARRARGETTQFLRVMVHNSQRNPLQIPAGNVSERRPPEKKARVVRSNILLYIYTRMIRTSYSYLSVISSLDDITGTLTLTHERTCVLLYFTLSSYHTRDATPYCNLHSVIYST